MSYYICVTNEKNFKIIKDTLIWGVNEYHKNKISKIKKGDLLIFYIQVKKLGGVFKVVSDLYYSRKMIFPNDLYSLRVKLKKIKIPREFIDISTDQISKLRFIKNKKRWGGSIQGIPMREIPEQDFNFLWGLF